jgi:penicillin amidase/acyl-homoserine-lactone acylase
MAADRSVTAEAFRRYKFDLAYSPRSDMAAFVAEALRIDAKGDPDLVQAQAILRGWSRATDVHNRATALAILMVQPQIKAIQANAPAPPVEPGLRAAIGMLKAHYGRLDPEWGEVNRIRRGTLDLPIDGGPDTYRAVYGALGPDGRLNAEAGDTFIMFVSWSSDGTLSSESVHQFGSATLDKHSPHYADQTPLFVAMKTKPVLFTEDQLKGHVREDYRPGHRG